MESRPGPVRRGRTRPDVPRWVDPDSAATFQSLASNLVPQDSNGRRALFVRDLSTNTTTLVSARADGKDSANDESSSPAWGRPAFDPRGGRLAFLSIARDLGSTDTNSSADVYLATLHQPT
jgi:hypothetical protein